MTIWRLGVKSGPTVRPRPRDGKTGRVTVTFPMNPAPRAGHCFVTADDDAPTLPEAARPGFRRATVRIEPGACRPYRSAEWVDCLVLIESGEIDLAAIGGGRQTVRGGDVLFLVGLPLLGLVNRGPAPAVITTVRRA